MTNGLVYNPRGDGNCLFEALAIYCDRPADYKFSLRAEMVSYCQKHTQALSEQINEVQPFAVTIRSFDPGTSFKTNEKEFTAPGGSSLLERGHYWRKYMSIGIDSKEQYPIYGNTESLVVLANVCNCRLFVLSESTKQGVWAVTKYAPMKENERTVSVSLWLRHEHFVIPAVDMEQFFGSPVSISGMKFSKIGSSVPEPSKQVGSTSATTSSTFETTNVSSTVDSTNTNISSTVDFTTANVPTQRMLSFIKCHSCRCNHTANHTCSRQTERA